MKNSMKFPEIPKDFVRPVTPLTKYWVNAEGMLTLDQTENVLVTQVGSPIALYKAEEVEALIDEVRQSEVDGLNNMHYVDACDAILAMLRKERG